MKPSQTTAIPMDQNEKRKPGGGSREKEQCMQNPSHRLHHRSVLLINFAPVKIFYFLNLLFSILGIFTSHSTNKHK